ncbi:angiotensin-converting enzyme-like [Oratosquilla oratoria]|uniref:angiotensin-converting enzyme-like n=1 Tax=Oratosquilla oratoria TaxID=337810 RepID=UPI003F75E35E
MRSISSSVHAFLIIVALLESTDTTSVELPGSSDLESKARSLLDDLSKQSSEKCTESVFASWAYYTNITDENKEKMLELNLEFSKWEKGAWKQVMEWKDRWPQLKNDTLKREFKLLSILGTSALDEADLEKFNHINVDMTSIYSKAKICDFKDKTKCDLKLEPEIKKLLTKSRNVDELNYVWTEWRDQTGKKMRELYKQFVKLSNKAAKLNGFDNMGDMWIMPYESDTFRQDVDDLWTQLKPLYRQIHAYVRRKLREVYSKDVISKRGPIPANLMGNMWAQSWSEVSDLMVPYPKKSFPDIDAELKAQGYTTLQMFELSDEYFKSLNLTEMPEPFWKHSMIERPDDRDVVCHASAWDFCNGVDFRIKQCTSLTMKDLITVHHEMGHIQYYLQYKHLPAVFRAGANPGFHEAVGDTLALSVSTPKHLHKIGLLKELHKDKEVDINYLMKMALDKIVFLPFSVLMDRWRWDVFSGKNHEDNWNCAWWKLRYELQGIKPPHQARTENDFDPGAKYHIPANVPYVRYFISFVLQFQFHKALCGLADQYDPQDPSKPLHQCDIYQSTTAGNAFADLLKLGSSKHWSVALKALTGEDKIDASAIKEYFKPLEEWLIEDNTKHGEFIGWEKDGDYCIGEKTDDDPSPSGGQSLLFSSWYILVLIFTLCFQSLVR